MMEWLLQNVFGCSATFFAVFSVILVVIIMGIKDHSSHLKDNQRLKLSAHLREIPKFAACKSPDCVRCQKYLHVRQDARNKLQDYLHKNDSKALVKVILALDDHVSPRKYTMQNPNVFFMPGIAAKPWWDDSRKLFEEDLSLLQNNFEEIKAELVKAFELQNSEDCSRYWSKNDTEAGQWNIFCFYNQGSKMIDNCLQCPKTWSVIEQLPHFMQHSIFGNALFSVLYPGITITVHYGPSNLRIRCHLGKYYCHSCAIRHIL
jgi:hypothetical protein